MKVFTSSNLAMFNDVLEEELQFFTSKAFKAQRIARGIIREFVSRTLQRIVYGAIQLVSIGLIFQVWVRTRNSTGKLLYLGTSFEKSSYTITFLCSTKYRTTKIRTLLCENLPLMSSVSKVNCKSRILEIPPY